MWAPTLCTAAAVCLAATGLAPVGGLRHDAAPSVPPLRSLREQMAAAPKDPIVQHGGCVMLTRLIRQNSPDRNPTTKREAVSDEMLTNGIGEDIALALLRLLALPDPEYDYASVCLEAVYYLHVDFTPDKEALLLKYSPDLPRALVKYAKTFKDHRNVLTSLINMCPFGFPPVPAYTRPIAEAGGFDLAFETLENHASDLEVTASAWFFLGAFAYADHAAALLIANHGGAAQGIKFIIQAMRENHGKKFSKYDNVSDTRTSFHQNLLHVATGILLNDDEGATFRKTFVEAGFVKELVEMMKDQPDERAVQDTACQAISVIAEGDETNQASLEKAGALDLAVEAIKAFSEPAEGGMRIYHVVSSCSAALLSMAQGRPKMEDKLKAMGVADLLKVKAPKHKGWDISVPWAQKFSDASIGKLQQVLDRPSK